MTMPLRPPLSLAFLCRLPEAVAMLRVYSLLGLGCLCVGDLQVARKINAGGCLPSAPPRDFLGSPWWGRLFFLEESEVPPCF